MIGVDILDRLDQRGGALWHLMWKAARRREPAFGARLVDIVFQLFITGSPSSLLWYCQLGSLPSLATVAPPVGFKAELSAAATVVLWPEAAAEATAQHRIGFAVEGPTV